MKKKKILIAAGGTGGHLLPAQQLAELIGDRADIFFAGHNLDCSPFFKKDRFPFVNIIASPIQKRFAFFRDFCKGLIQSICLLRKEKPDVVVGFGSYHTVPILFASVLMRKKIVLYEANRTMGKVTGLFAPFSTHLAAQFPMINQKNFTLVPLYPWVRKPKVSKQDARLEYGLDLDCFTILVFGGSQGAGFLNEIVPKVIASLGRPVQVIHFGLSETPYSVKSVVKQFESDMAKAYAAADFVIGRSGAGTVSELIHFAVPSLLIPYPFAYGHQQDNAEYLVATGGAFMLLQKEATLEKISYYIESADLKQMSCCLQRVVENDRITLEDLVL